MSFLNNAVDFLDQLGNAAMGLPDIGLPIGGLAESASKLLGEAVEEVPKVVSEVEKGVEELYTAGKNFVEETLGGSSAKGTADLKFSDKLSLAL